MKCCIIIFNFRVHFKVADFCEESFFGTNIFLEEHSNINVNYQIRSLSCKLFLSYTDKTHRKRETNRQKFYFWLQRISKRVNSLNSPSRKFDTKTMNFLPYIDKRKKLIIKCCVENEKVNVNEKQKLVK